MLSWTTGMLACGYTWRNTDQVPWSRPQASSPRTRRGAILHLVKLARKAAEIVDRPRRTADSDGGIFDVPMGGDSKYCLWPRHSPADGRPPVGIRVFEQRIHWVSVANEQRWHSHGDL